jgi:[ribosomal protein S5]-alanine N-acetyltransferase
MTESTLKTERLRLVPAIESNAAALHQLMIQPQVRQYLCDDEIWSFEQVQAMVNESVTAFREQRYGLWMAQQSDRIIGFTGYWQFPTPLGLQLVYALAPEYWGQGLATEMAQALVEYGLQIYGFQSIRTSIDVPNTASIAVAQRLGMTLVEQVAIDGKELVTYELTAA